jgi:hypothetical protein
MKPHRNIAGQKFGRLLAVEIVDKTNGASNRITYWRCICDCGNEKIVALGHLISGSVKSCGCLKDEICRDRVVDIKGQKFGRLLVINKVEARKRGMVCWLCKCDCGNEIIVDGKSLRTGNTSSCGCLARELTISRVQLPKGEASLNGIWCSYRYGAKQRSIDFKLTKEEFKNIITQNCYYCGTPPIEKLYNKEQNGSCLVTGIDRVDNSHGYEFNNVVPCCEICNRAKLIMPQDVFIAWVKRISDHMRKVGMIE